MNRIQRDKLSACWHSRMQFDVSMAYYSTLRAGGRADGLIEVHNLNEVQKLVAQLDAEQIRYQVIGRGSNILVSDRGFSGVIVRLTDELNAVIHLERKKNKKSKGSVLISAGAGCSMAGLVSWCSGHGLSGLEFMAGIPGSVGGAIRMNAGAWGHEIGEQLQAIEVVGCKGHCRRLLVSELQLSYRRLGLQKGCVDTLVITSATLKLTPEREEQIRGRCKDYLRRRKGKQPTGIASAGSFFKNPEGDSAGRLIEAAGLKGVCQGQAMVSPVHANFIVNTGSASATDIIELMQQVQAAVFQRFAVSLEPEVQIL